MINILYKIIKNSARENAQCKIFALGPSRHIREK